MGENIFGGSTNINGTILAKIAKNPKESLLEGIISSLQQSASKKLNIARLADKISNILVPSVIAISLLTLIIWKFYASKRSKSSRNYIIYHLGALGIRFSTTISLFESILIGGPQKPAPELTTSFVRGVMSLSPYI